MAKAIIHFEIQASDVERAKKFYEAVFEWSIEQYPGMEYWGVTAGRSKGMDGGVIGINGGLLPRKGDEPADGAAVNAFVCTLEVEDIDAVTKQVQDAGGKVVVEKVAIPSMAWQAYCKDTEGNIFGLFQADPTAA